MVPRLLGRLWMCPACGGPTEGPVLCTPCCEAFRLAGNAHPSEDGTRPSADQAPADVDDLDMWDAWSLLGDVGDRPGRAHAG